MIKEQRTFNTKFLVWNLKGCRKMCATLDINTSMDGTIQQRNLRSRYIYGFLG